MAKISGPTTESEAVTEMQATVRKNKKVKAPTAGMIPLDEQVTESEQTADETTALAVPESAGDAKVAKRLPVQVDPTLPWAGWPNPDVFEAAINTMSVRPNLVENGRLILVGESGDDIGEIANSNAFQQLGWLCSPMPTDFVEKLTPETQALVVNERMRQSPKEVNVIIEGGQVANFVRGGRGIPPYSEVAQTAFNALRSVYGETVEIVQANQARGGMDLRFVTGVELAVTRKKGDILQMGIQVHQDYGHDLSLALYVQRLICLNGMTAENRDFTWRVRDSTSIEHQLAWLVTGISEVVGAYDRIVERARQMAARPVINPNIPQVLEEYARAIRFPVRYLARVIEAYQQEPDPTEWGILNAFTRAATHAMSGAAQSNILAAAGQWTQEFDPVLCRLPRPLAARLGAEVVE